MILIATVAVAALYFALCVLGGRGIRYVICNIGTPALYAADAVTGFGTSALATLWIFRLAGSLRLGAVAGFALLIGAVIGGFAKPFDFRQKGNIAAKVIGGTFVLAVTAVYLPTMYGTGATFYPPPIYDLPKHFLAITALANSPSWPPTSPFFPNATFAYNYLFYCPIAGVIALTGWSNLEFVALPIFLIAVTSVYLWLVTDLADVMGLPRRWHGIAVLLAIWLGGLTPLLVGTFPALGFMLLDRTGYPIWADEPFISSIFVPQHIYAAVTTLTVLWFFAQNGVLWGTLACAVLVAASGSLSSLILAPLVSVILAIVSVRTALSERAYASRVTIALAAGVTYFLLLFPFLREAVEWRGPEGSLVGAPFFGLSLWLVAAELGPCLPLALLGLSCGLSSSRRAVLMDFALVLGAVAILALTVRYEDGSIKALLLLRILLVPPAAYGAAVLWRISNQYFQLLWAALATVLIAINLPTVGWYVRYSWQPMPSNLTNFITELRNGNEDRRPLFDTNDQVVVALAARPVLMDFRTIRSDAYLPFVQRKAYDEFFNSLAKNEPPTVWAALRMADMIIVPSSRTMFWSKLIGPADATALGLTLFRNGGHPNAR